MSFLVFVGCAKQLKKSKGNFFFIPRLASDQLLQVWLASHVAIES